MLYSFFVLVHAKFAKGSLFKFVLGLNQMVQDNAGKFVVISSNPKSVLLTNPDIILLRKNNKK